ncbi:YIP1 family protein [Myxococcus stipitatus]|nr:Yip1 family protein [Myxococcus stipitatus]
MLRVPESEVAVGEGVALEVRESLPWDRRAELGGLAAFSQTCRDVLLRPVSTFERMKPEESVGGSLLFALLCYAVACFPTCGLYFLLESLRDGDTWNLGRRYFGARDSEVRSFIIYLGLSPLVLPVVTLVAAGLDHALLRGGGSARSFHTTLRGHVLSLAPCLVGLLPCFSLPVIPLWCLGLRIVAHRKLHRVSWTHAMFGSLGFPIAVVVGWFLFISIVLMAFLLDPIGGSLDNDYRDYDGDGVSDTG